MKGARSTKGVSGKGAGKSRSKSGRTVATRPREVGAIQRQAEGGYDRWVQPQQVQNFGGYSQVSQYNYESFYQYQGQPVQYQYDHGYQSPEWPPGFGSMAAGYPTSSSSWHPYQALAPYAAPGLPYEFSQASAAFPAGFESPSEPPLPTSLMDAGQAQRLHDRTSRTNRQANVPVHTLVVHNVPAGWSSRDLINLFQREGAAAGYHNAIDFFFLPYRSKQRRYSRYAFINFTSTAAAGNFRRRWDNAVLQDGQSAIALGNAHTQGLAANLFLHLHVLNGRSYGQTSRPWVFRDGHQVDPAQMWERVKGSLTMAEREQVRAQAAQSQTQGAPATSRMVGIGRTVWHL